MVLGGPTDLINRLATMEVVSQPLSPQCWEKILNYECTTMKCTHIVLLEESFRIVINTAAIAAGRAPVLLVLLVLVVLILLLLCQCSCCSCCTCAFALPLLVMVPPLVCCYCCAHCADTIS